STASAEATTAAADREVVLNDLGYIFSDLLAFAAALMEPTFWLPLPASTAAIRVSALRREGCLRGFVGSYVRQDASVGDDSRPTEGVFLAHSGHGDRDGESLL